METWILRETEHAKDTRGSSPSRSTHESGGMGQPRQGVRPESCRTMGGVGLERDPRLALPGSVQGSGVT